jgi:hypothetical protein
VKERDMSETFDTGDLDTDGDEGGLDPHSAAELL